MQFLFFVFSRFLTTALAFELNQSMVFISLPPSPTKPTFESFFIKPLYHFHFQNLNLWNPNATFFFLTSHTFSLPSHHIPFLLSHWTIENKKPCKLWFHYIHIWSQFKPSYRHPFFLFWKPRLVILQSLVGIDYWLI